MSLLLDLKIKCSMCGTGHLETPCNGRCICRCRKCNARLYCFASLPPQETASE